MFKVLIHKKEEGKPLVIDLQAGKNPQDNIKARYYPSGTVTPVASANSPVV
jgi:hypothetical protein